MSEARWKIRNRTPTYIVLSNKLNQTSPVRSHYWLLLICKAQWGNIPMLSTGFTHPRQISGVSPAFQNLCGTPLLNVAVWPSYYRYCTKRNSSVFKLKKQRISQGDLNQVARLLMCHSFPSFFPKRFLLLGSNRMNVMGLNSIAVIFAILFLYSHILLWVVQDLNLWPLQCECSALNQLS